MVEHTPVAIVGAGPVGLTLALLLARQGVASVVLERHAAAYPLPRAVHLDDVALRILQAAGVASDVVALGRPMTGMRLLDKHLHTMVEFARDARDTGVFGYHQSTMVHQPDLDGLLLARAGAEPLINLRRGDDVHSVAPVAGGAVVSHLRDGTTEHLNAEWVVGCDGTNSTVRAAICTRMHDLGFAERWLIVDVETDRPLDIWGGVHQICDPRRAVTFMHVVGHRYRWELRLAAGETADTLIPRLPELLAPWTAGVDVTVVRAAEYSFRAEVAERWRSGRLLIAGDAAHQSPPFIGQGLGAGLRDAENLAWKLVAAMRGTDLLDTYETERRPQATAAIRASIVVGWALTRGQQRAARLRRVVVTGIGRIPQATAAAAKASSPRLGAGPLVARRRADRLVGTLCPQPLPGFDMALGTGWWVLSHSRMGTRIRVVTLSELDVHVRPTFAAWLALGHAHAVLIRPDHIVAALARAPEEVPAMLAVATRSVGEQPADRPQGTERSSTSTEPSPKN